MSLSCWVGVSVDTFFWWVGSKLDAFIEWLGDHAASIVLGTYHFVTHEDKLGFSGHHFGILLAVVVVAVIVALIFHASIPRAEKASRAQETLKSFIDNWFSPFCVYGFGLVIIGFIAVLVCSGCLWLLNAALPHVQE